ncbi:hypothetical protein [Serratia marcescens]|uniref:hypothetical protein n=1 Tax=Serratia marcescens TaxID=615 RepID=UPI0021C27FD4|nr:hypothetical protein [Serratia marcescens]
MVTGSGRMSEVNGRSVALVGSRLNNGDEIISTPQSSEVLLHREGEQLPGDLLTEKG